MSPSGELDRLALRKQLLVAKSDLLRLRVAASAEVMGKPITWIQGALSLVRKAAPVVGLSAMLFTRSKPARKAGWFGMAMKFAPTVLKAFRAFKQAG